MDHRSNGYGYSRSGGYRSQSWSRSSPGSVVSSSYRRTVNAPVSKSYGSAVFSLADGGDFGHNSFVNADYKRSNEKEQLQGLNDRFVVYIDKVHFLEQQNQQIEAEIQALRQKQASRCQLDDRYQQELQELRATLEQIHHDKAQIQLDTEHVDEDIQRLRDRFEEEARIREETEAIIRVLKKDTCDSELMKSELEKKVQSLQDEIAFIRNNHEEEVSELIAQIQESQVTVERRDLQRANITDALREIRCELEGHSNQNLQQVENLFMCRFAKLTEAADQNKDAIKSARDEITDYRRQLQTKTVELESVRGTRDSLERQLNDIEDRHSSDLASLQETIHQLDNELKSTKWEMARHLREYQDLLNVKMALDIEIAAYRKLLDGEETHFSTFPYRQAVTSSKTSKPKLKVQHKFVEEIIEETRVEDEKADFDEALADLAQELSESQEKGGEEEEEGGEDTAGEEEEGEEGEEVEEEEVVVASAKAKVSASPPAKDEDKDGKEDGEDDEDGEGEEGEEGEGDDEEGEEEEEEEVEETVLCAKVQQTSASKASPEKEKPTEKGGSDGEEDTSNQEEDTADEKASKDGDETEDTKDAEDKNQKDEKSVKEEKEDQTEKPVEKSEGSKTEASDGKASKEESKPGSPKSESPKPDSPKSDSSKPDSPKSESPKPSSPKSESPKPSSPKSESPKPSSPKSESPKPSSPKSESPKPSSPKSESPKPSSPKSESPKPSSPKSESTKPSSPKSESPKPSSPKSESPKPTSPKPDSPKPDSPKSPESPKSESPKAESPKGDQPKSGAAKAPEDTSEKKGDTKEDKKVEKKDAAMNGDVEKSSPAEKQQEATDDVLANGVDESPIKDDSSQKVVITKTVETITTGEDGSKHVTKSVTVTETMKEVEEVLQEQLVATKKTEKQSTQSIKQVTEGEKA